MTSPPPPVDPARLEANWRAVAVELDVPRPPRLERLLRRLGLPARLTRVAVATPALRRSWLVAVGLAALFALSAADAADPRRSLVPLLVVAPLGPVLGVALAFGAAADPEHEMVLATPTSGLRLVLVRSTTVVLTAMAIFGLTTLLTPVRSLTAVGWLLPSLALAALTLALATSVRVGVAASVTAGGWLGLLLVVQRVTDDALVAFGPVGQAGAAVVLAGAILVVLARTDRFDVVVNR